MNGKVTARDVIALLKKRYDDGRQYAYATEVADSTGGGTRRLDMVVMNCYQSKGFAIEGIEVKVSKSDLRRELQDASKHNIFFHDIDYYSLACPEEIIDMKLIPEKWGIYAVKTLPDGTFHLYAKRKPLALCDEGHATIRKCFAASFIRSVTNSALYHDEIARAREKAYQKGVERGREMMCRADVDKLIRENDEHKELSRKLGLWGDGDIARGIERYEQFRKIDSCYLRENLQRMQSVVESTLEAMDAKEVDDGLQE